VLSSTHDRVVNPLTHETRRNTIDFEIAVGVSQNRLFNGGVAVVWFVERLSHQHAHAQQKAYCSALGQAVLRERMPLSLGDGPLAISALADVHGVGLDRGAELALVHLLPQMGKLRGRLPACGLLRLRHCLLLLSLRNSNKTACKKGTGTFCSEDSAK
jgi:hypothetical protein